MGCRNGRLGQFVLDGGVGNDAVAGYLVVSDFEREKGRERVWWREWKF